MQSCKAIVVAGKGEATIQSVPQPRLDPEWVLVRVRAVALNPTDWKKLYGGAGVPGLRMGCEYAGVVEEVGEAVTRFRKGDRIAGVVHGCDKTRPENGAFAELIVAKAALQFHIPEHWTFEQVATIGVSLITIVQGLYDVLKLPSLNTPTSSLEPILIHAASTTVGSYGVQFAKASGCQIIATASPHNFDYVKSLGADHVFDYKSPTCSAEIKAVTKGKLVRAWDCMGTGGKIIAEALSDSQPSVYATINPVEDADTVRKKNPNIDGPHFTLGYDCFGEDYMWLGKHKAGDAKELAAAAQFVVQSERLMSEGIIKPIRVSLNSTGEGLEGAVKGLEEQKSGRVSGAKLVYTL